MSKKGEHSFFWVSYADLMTSLFFVMLVLVVVLVAHLGRETKRVEDLLGKYRANEQQVKKIKELERATQDLDSAYFEYNKEYKKFILRIPITFQKGSADMADVPIAQQNELYQAGRVLEQFIQAKHDSLGVDFLMIIEGQASRDNYIYNNELSYNRALALKNFWLAKGLDFGQSDSKRGLRGCELVVSGSGIGGQPRSAIEHENQRFLVTLINKPGLIQ